MIWVRNVKGKASKGNMNKKYKGNIKGGIITKARHEVIVK